LVRPNSKLDDLAQQFVCVRLVQMKGVDLRLFQFDWDLTMAVVFLNADGTIYGRFGTRAGTRGNQMTHVSEPALAKAMERALALHKAHPANRTELAGKSGQAGPHRFPEETPLLAKYAAITASNKWESCIECHKAGESEFRIKREAGSLTESDVWPYPLPENIGLRMNKDDGLRVQSVTADSAAAKAGIRAGDTLTKLGGQPLVSQADIQWVLHNSPSEGRVEATIVRDSQPIETAIGLQRSWRQRDVSWRSSITGLLPEGLHLGELSNSERQKRGIPPGQTGLQVRYSFDKASKAGVRMNDVVAAVDGKTDIANVGQFLEHIWLREKPLEKVVLTVLRKDERLEITVPVK
jgi:membrane-associated protease RseP (regulator of RpoE activity)